MKKLTAFLITLVLVLVCSVAFASVWSDSFETDLGNWSNDAGNDLNWTRLSGATPSTATGPSSASDGTYYIYLEASDRSADFNDIAILNFDQTLSGDSKISFDYHMLDSYASGAQMGFLALEAYAGSEWILVWAKYHENNSAWQSVSDLVLPANTTNIRFYAVVGEIRSDIALDNVVVTDNATVSRDSYTKYKADFETDFGDWSNEVSADDYDWTRYSGATPSVDSGPTAAHEGTYYIYCECTNQLNGTFQLNFDQTLGGNGGRLSFWLHAYGSDIVNDSLQIQYYDGSVWTNLETLPAYPLLQYNTWVPVVLDIPTGTTDLRFIYTSPSNYRGDLALDLIRVWDISAGTSSNLKKIGDTNVTDVGSIGGVSVGDIKKIGDQDL